LAALCSPPGRARRLTSLRNSSFSVKSRLFTGGNKGGNWLRCVRRRGEPAGSRRSANPPPDQKQAFIRQAGCKEDISPVKMPARQSAKRA